MFQSVNEIRIPLLSLLIFYWELKESGRDGDCHMYIYQKEYSRKIGLDPFNISVEINNKLVVLPFRKKINEFPLLHSSSKRINFIDLISVVLIITIG